MHTRPQNIKNSSKFTRETCNLQTAPNFSGLQNKYLFLTQVIQRLLAGYCYALGKWPELCVFSFPNPGNDSKGFCTIGYTLCLLKQYYSIVNCKDYRAGIYYLPTGKGKVSNFEQ